MITTCYLLCGIQNIFTNYTERLVESKTQHIIDYMINSKQIAIFKHRLFSFLSSPQARQPSSPHTTSLSLVPIHLHPTLSTSGKAKCRSRATAIPDLRTGPGRSTPSGSVDVTPAQLGPRRRGGANPPRSHVPTQSASRYSKRK